MHEHELDQLIDEALAAYEVEPSVDLASRILMEVRATPAIAPRRIYKAWAGAVTGIAAAGLLTLFLMHPGAKQQRTPEQIAAIAVGSTPTASTSNAPTVRSTSIGHPVHRTRQFAPKSAYTSPPMTEQEQMLLSLAAEHPKQALVLIAMNRKAGEPLSIEPLSTAPLRVEAMHVDPLPSRIGDTAVE